LKQGKELFDRPAAGMPAKFTNILGAQFLPILAMWCDRFYATFLFNLPGGRIITDEIFYAQRKNK